MVERKPENKSSSMLGGWKTVEGRPGQYTTEKTPQSFITDDFKKFGESSRARWNLSEYIKTKFTFNEILKKFLKGKDLSKIPAGGHIVSIPERDIDGEKEAICEISSTLDPLDKTIFRNINYEEPSQVSGKKGKTFGDIIDNAFESTIPEED